MAENIVNQTVNNRIRVSPEAISINPFKSIGRGWMLIGASDGDNINAMTASWGALGVLWGKNVFYCHIRPQRYTYELIERSDYITLSVFDADFMPNDEIRKKLAYMGRVSGRDENKLDICGLKPLLDGNFLSFAEAKTVFYGRKLYFDDFSPDNFLSPDIEKHYEKIDYHRTYICEITDAFISGAVKE